MAQEGTEELDLDDIGNLNGFDLDDESLDLEDLGLNTAAKDIDSDSTMNNDLEDVSLDADFDGTFSLDSDLGDDVDLDKSPAAEENSTTPSDSTSVDKEIGPLSDDDEFDPSTLKMSEKESTTVNEDAANKSIGETVAAIDESSAKDIGLSDEELSLDGDLDLLDPDKLLENIDIESQSEGMENLEIDERTDDIESLDFDIDDPSDVPSQKDSGETATTPDIVDEIDSKDQEEGEGKLAGDAAGTTDADLDDDSLLLDIDQVEESDETTPSIEEMSDLEDTKGKEIQLDLNDSEIDFEEEKTQSDSMILDATMEIKEADMASLEEKIDSEPPDGDGMENAIGIATETSLNDIADANAEVMQEIAENLSRSSFDLAMDEPSNTTEEVICLEDEILTKDLESAKQDDTAIFDDKPSDLGTLDSTDSTKTDFADPTIPTKTDMGATEATTDLSPSTFDESELPEQRKKKSDDLLGRDLLFTLPHCLTVEIGKANLKGEDIASLNYGSVIELNKKITDPVDVLFGKKVIAKGDVVQINEEKLGIRITRICL